MRPFEKSTFHASTISTELIQKSLHNLIKPSYFEIYFPADNQLQLIVKLYFKNENEALQASKIANPISLNRRCDTCPKFHFMKRAKSEAEAAARNLEIENLLNLNPLPGQDTDAEMAAANALNV